MTCPRSPFRHASFTVLWTATMVANIGGWMYSAASGWLMTTRSRPVHRIDGAGGNDIADVPVRVAGLLREQYTALMRSFPHEIPGRMVGYVLNAILALTTDRRRERGITNSFEPTFAETPAGRLGQGRPMGDLGYIC
jgi:hypothetical protein